MKKSSDLTKRMDNLSAEQRALLEKKLREKKKVQAAAKRIPKRLADGPVPLSFPQQRLWFLYQMEPDSAMYNMPVVLRLEGELQKAALMRSFTEIIRRHEGLRTRFTLQDGVPVQRIDDATAFTLQDVDLRNLPESEREAESHRLIRADVERTFDLENGPLLRATLVQLKDQEHLLILNNHHIVSDGWSTGILVQEMCELYQAYSSGQESPLRELPIQYADYAMWQLDRMQGTFYDRLLAYWNEQLGGNLPVLQLPTDAPRPAAQTFRGDTVRFLIGRQQVDALNELAREQESTLYMALLAVFNVLLHRYTGQEDILVGSPIANRNLEEIEGLIGFFVNTLVMRTDLSQEPTFAELLNRVRKMTLDAYAHQDLPFEKLVAELMPERTQSHSPLFQVMFVLQNAPMSELQLPGMNIKREPIEHGTAKFDLTIFLTESAEGIQCVFEYNADLFVRTTIERMGTHFQTLVEAVTATPERKIHELPLLTEAERQQLLTEWNDTAADYPKHSTIHRVFAEQVERTPDAIAVVDQERSLTYRELDRRANQLARRLQLLGVEADTCVGLCVERSLEMIVSILAILKAGGAYVPLDPSYPAERLAFMMQDTNTPLLLTQQHLADQLPPSGAAKLLIDQEWAQISELSDEPFPCIGTGEHLAYINYTSGSTGMPKGVCVPHRAVLRLVKNNPFVDFSADQVFLQFATVSFDAATFEIWGSLLNGARLVLFPFQRASLSELGAALRRYQVTTLWLTAGLFHQMVDHHLEDLRGIKQLLAGGDALSVLHVKKVLNELKGIRMVNGYGPTESTTFACCYSMSDPEQVGTSVPIGHPIANTQVYVLDRQMNPVPVGVPGELHIGGDGLAHGYLNRPDLTEERFVFNPFAADPDSKLYKTGDVVRYLPDGRIEFLGRMDNQVKIRGYRIELGEIEGVLAEHPNVKSEVVLTESDPSGEKLLVAFVVLHMRREEEEAELRKHLRAKLPEYMVPSHLAIVEELPLNAIGKVDRKKLLTMDWRSGAAEADHEEPRNELEAKLAKIWSELLNLETIGIHHNFFEIGGHSLLATRLMTRISDVLGAEIPLRDFFAAPTVAGLAAAIEAARGESGAQGPAILPVERDGNIPLSFAQERLWFFEEFLPGTATYNVPGAIRISGPLNVQALENSFRAIIRRHETLRTTFEKIDGQPMQVIHRDLAVSLPLVDLRGESEDRREEQLRLRLAQEAGKPFDLSRPPLVRMQLFQLADTEHVLFLNMHHIICDGWSMSILIRELIAFYQSGVNVDVKALPELPIQYADFSIWQRKWLQGDVLNQQRDYWKQQLGGKVPVLQLATDRPRPAVRSYRGSTHSFVLSPELSQGVHELSRKQGATPFMTLLSVLEALLYRYTGQTDFAIGTPVANRRQGETEGLIGFFVNTLVMRADLEGNPAFTELLSRVRRTALDAYDHQDIPFEQLVEDLQPERDPSYSPLFQVMFVLQNNENAAWELPGLSIQALSTDSGTAKFDLTLSMQEGPNGFVAKLEYDADLFDAATIEALSVHFCTLLQSVVTDAGLRLSDLPMLTEDERRRLLIEWNDTATDCPLDRTIHQQFVVQAAKTPDSIAVVLEDQQLTYRELDSRSTRLARYLLQLGVRQGELIGLCMERSLEMIVSLLAILKAGGGYVPINPADPVERQTFMLQDARVSLLLTHQHLRGMIPGQEARIVCVDSEWEQVNGLADEPLPETTNAGEVAYVNYTSGSTGTPKGVCVPHRAVLRLVKNNPFANFSADEVFLQFATLSFDAATFEIWGSLLNGARLVLFPLPKASLSELGSSLRRHRITTLWLTAGLFQQMVDHHLTDLSHLKQLLAGGDALSVPHVKKVLTELKGLRMINGYGPTESTTFTCCYSMTDPEQVGTSVPIGRPIANTQVYVLDPHMNPVPVGVPGELHIGGSGLALGYLNRPELTEERFVPNPFAAEPDSKLYKSGDLVRYLPDGRIEFLGRIDNQVKVRGYRIELGEIEAQLVNHANVRSAAVLTQDDMSGDKRLLAFAVLHQPSEDAANELRKHLRVKLPDYMIPSQVIVVDELPLNSNGKVDRRALLALQPEAPDSGEQACVQPRNDVEQSLVRIWSDILQRGSVGVTDNFFELGGHSLLATRLMTRVASEFGADIPLQQFFIAPTIAELAEQIGQKNEQRTPVPVLVPIARDGQLALSFAQERIWFFEKLLPGTTTYSIPDAIRIRGALQAQVLEQSFRQVVQRHESLRTTFVTADGQAVQVIAQDLVPNVPILDLQHVPQAEQEAHLQRLLTDESHRPFDLAQGPLVRMKLYKLHSEEHVLFINMHHIISDGWSMGIFVKELMACYRAIANGEKSALAELTIQYADFANWQREWLEGITETQLGYWKQQLAGELPILQLPTDSVRPTTRSYRGNAHLFRLPAELTESLQALNQQEGVTPFMTLLAVFQVLLHRYTGQTDLLVGTPVANRRHADAEPLIGFFVNTLVLRTDVAGNPSFRELLHRVRQVALEAYDHQDIPFERLVEELQPGRDMSHTPLFQVMFVLQNNERADWNLPGLSVEPVTLENHTAKFDLTLTLSEEASGFSGRLEYSTDLFEDETIRRLADHFVHLLQGALTQPEQSIGRLPMLSDAERQHLLEWGAARREFPVSQSIAERFEEQAARHSQRIAVSCAGQELTYAQLNARANQLANYLVERGIRPESRVGLAFERSLEMIIAILGVLKAGAAYVPLDSNSPRERIAFIAEDSGMELLITQESLAQKLPEHQVPVLHLDAEWHRIAQQPDSNLSGLATPDLVAYIIYTSGSTGKPKGVLVNHSNVIRLFDATDEWYGFHEQDVWTLFHSYAFDFSVWEIWGALLYGGKLIVVPYLTSRSPKEFYRLLVEEQVTVLNQTPSAFRQLIHVEDEPDSRDELALRYVIFGGEALELQSLQPWFDRHGDRQPQLVNMYGITETTVHVTYRPINRVDLESKGSFIGEPIPDLMLAVLDPFGQQVPVGVPGELYVGGAGVALGYLNRPELTAERFLEREAGRLYRSGDLVRILANGDLDYLGRIDQQVKVRGFRIELGEIEEVLAKHPHVRENVVDVRVNGTGEPVLVAYVALQKGALTDMSELRRLLKASLPDYMIPSAFVELDYLPLTTNGKVDRRALPEPQDLLVQRQAEIVAPRDTIETELVRIWEEVLNVSPISVHDNFFDLGGHSLLAVRLMTRIHQAWERDLPLSALFEEGTVEGLANLLRGEQLRPAAAMVEIQTHGDQRPFFCIHPIGGNVLAYHELSRALGDRQPFYCLQAPALVDPAAVPLTNIREMAARYLDELRSVQPKGPYVLGGWSFGGVVAYEMAQQLQSQGEIVDQVVMFDSFVPEASAEQDEATQRLLFMNELIGGRGREVAAALATLPEPLSQLEPERAFETLLEEAKRLELLPAELSQSHVARLYEVYKANIRAYYDYQPAPYSGPVLLFKATNTEDHLLALPGNGWDRYLTGPFRVQELPCDHYSIMHQPFAGRIADQMKHSR